LHKANLQVNPIEFEADVTRAVEAAKASAGSEPKQKKKKKGFLQLFVMIMRNQHSASLGICSNTVLTLQGKVTGTDQR
jgi:hypothetical protein